MSQRIPAKYKAQLGESLATWYRHFGSVAPRRPYHEDDDTDSGAQSYRMLEEHPLLAMRPIGASSDLAAVISEDSRTRDTLLRRQAELGNTLQYRLALTQKQRLEQRPRSTSVPKPTPF